MDVVRGDMRPSSVNETAAGSGGVFSGVVILVTGGTGFVGSHTVAALLERGHRVRLLVRSRSRVGPALSPLGIAADAIEIAEGDVTREESVRAALEGCDGVLHAAAVFS